MPGYNWGFQQDGGGGAAMGGMLGGGPPKQSGGIGGPRQFGGQAGPGGQQLNQQQQQMLDRGNQGLQNMIGPSRVALDRAQAQCARGDGAACQLAQRLAREYQEAQMRHQQEQQFQNRSRGGGAMGTNGLGGGSGVWAEPLMQGMYGGGWGGMG